jgi:heavy metal translocating P-type ATPase
MPARSTRDYGRQALLAAATIGLAAGGLLHLLSLSFAGDVVWALMTAVVLLPTLYSSVLGLLRGRTGVDLIAVLAMAGTLALSQYLAGAILALMITGGTALERYAMSRAERELTALLSRAPRIAHRRSGETVMDVPADEVAVGDRLLVKTGEVVPTDGLLEGSSAVLDEAAITGESRPRELHAGELIRSGAANTGSSFTYRATAAAAESTYAGIVRLVRGAAESKAPFVRLADRYAVLFLVLTLGLAAAVWLASGQALRALAVLVVATPCPLLLAAPAAIVAGISRAARYGVIIKGGGALEALAQARVLLLDKTGTITGARPRVAAVESFGRLGADELVRLAASLEQLSAHPFAPAIVAEAHERTLTTSFPSEAREELGAGIAGKVDNHTVALGQLAWVAPPADKERPAGVRSLQMRTAVEGSSSVFVAVDGELQGALVLHDPIRTEAPRALAALRKAGIKRIHMVTGDHPDVAELVGDAVGADRVFAERTPEEKVAVVRLVRAEGITIMLGDGINDAPALALADVGVAMGARGATAASEAADVVLTADRLEGLTLALRLAQRTRAIALESVIAGMTLSVLAMVAAAAGALTPAAGALLQEAIDVVVIANALRALSGGGLSPRRAPGSETLARHFQDEHRLLRPRLVEMASLATRLDTLAPQDAQAQLERVREFLLHDILPHEHHEQSVAYPHLAVLFKSEDPTGPLIQTHHEIARLARLYCRLVTQVPQEGPGAEELRALRRALYGLDAILQLHFSQEEELYAVLGR